MKALVVYYSRTGTTRQVGEEIAERLGASSDEILDKKSRKGGIGWLKAGWDAKGQKRTEIEAKTRPDDFDLIIVGTPVWGGKVTPAIRTYLQNYDLANKKVAFFTTQGGDDATGAITELKQMVKKSEIVDILSIRSDDVKADNYQTHLETFVERLRQ
jgi:flavodoxin